MKLRHHLLLCILLTLAASAAWWADRDQRLNRRADPVLGTPFLDAEVLERAASILIEQLPERPDQERHDTLLERGLDGTWRLPRLDNLPVDEARLSELRRDLAEATIVRTVAAASEEPDPGLRLGLRRLTAQGADGQVLLEVEFGAEETMFHAYARSSQQRGVFLVRHNALLDGIGENWVDRFVAPFDPATVARVTVEYPADGSRLEVSRVHADSLWAAEGEGPERLLRVIMVDRMVRNLAEAAFARHLPADTPAVVAARARPLRRVSMRFFDGGDLVVTVAAADPQVPPSRTTDRPDVLVFFDGEGAAAGRARTRYGTWALQYWSIDVIGRWPETAEGFFTDDPELIMQDCLSCP